MATLDVYDMIVIEDRYTGIYQECVESVDMYYAYTNNFKIKIEDFTVEPLNEKPDWDFVVKEVYKRKDHNTYIKTYELPDQYPEYQVGEAVLYQNGDRFELGIIKSVCGNNEYFVWYHTGDTAARTHARHLHKISNEYAFHIIRLDPDDKERR